MCRFFSYSYSLLLNYLLQKVVQAKVLHRFNISYTAVSRSAFCPPCGGPASCVFQMVLLPASPPRHPRPATNLIRRRRSPVWLAIWRTWAGFANSQHRYAPSPHLIIYVRILLCCHIELLLRQTQIFRPICADCLRHLRISAE